MNPNTMIMIDRLQRSGASENEIVRAVEEMNGEEHRERLEPLWRRLALAIFVS